MDLPPHSLSPSLSPSLPLYLSIFLSLNVYLCPSITPRSPEPLALACLGAQPAASRERCADAVRESLHTARRSVPSLHVVRDRTTSDVASARRWLCEVGAYLGAHARKDHILDARVQGGSAHPVITQIAWPRRARAIARAVTSIVRTQTRLLESVRPILQRRPT
jgi:hypothetical protein